MGHFILSLEETCMLGSLLEAVCSACTMSEARSSKKDAAILL